MKNTGSRDIVAQVMNEYVQWGGPIVTRIEAYNDCIAKGMTAREADYCAFGRQAVPAPADPAGHLAFLRQIQSLEAAREAVAA